MEGLIHLVMWFSLKLSSFSARCGLAMGSGAIYAASYPPLGLRWCVLLGVGGLLVALRGQQGSRARTLGFLHGLTAFAVSLSWLFQIFGWISVMLFAVLAVFTALFAEMQSRAASRGIQGWGWVLFTAVNWCGWEFIRAEIFSLKLPWLTAGLALGPNGLLPWIGVYGVSFVVILIVALAVVRKPLIAGMLAIPILLFPTKTLPTLEAKDPQVVKIAGVQLESVSLPDFLEETAKLPPDVRYVVWPEYALPYDIRKNPKDWECVQNLCRERDITLTLGTKWCAEKGDDWRNIALTLDASGVRGEHNKVHTVHLFNDGIAGTTALPVSTGHGKVGTPICFDCDYEGIVRKMTASGAEMLMVPIMDAASWTAKQHDQHAELFRLRACENGRWMCVCATSGVSQIIAPNGQVSIVRRIDEPGAFTGMMKRLTALTLYTRIGWIFPWCVLGIAVVSWLILMLPKRLFPGADFTVPLQTPSP
jgi:apolipoprotein N-acyltransferase